MRRFVILVSLVALSMSACASSGEPEPSIDEELTLPPTSDPMATFRAKSPGPVGGSVTGTLGFDDIEGGCAFLQAGDGTRYEVIYPDGWTLDRMAGVLRGPAGEVVGAGQSFKVHGSIASDRSSICQIGPIFVATEVQIDPR
jgi:hypothetical protein